MVLGSSKSLESQETEALNVISLVSPSTSEVDLRGQSSGLHSSFSSSLGTVKLGISLAYWDSLLPWVDFLLFQRRRLGLHQHFSDKLVLRLALNVRKDGSGTEISILRDA